MLMNKHQFKYKVSFYYQSTIIYFIAFVIYIIIRGEVVDGNFTLIIKDPVIYFFSIIVVFSLLSLLFNLYKKKYLEINDDRILFVDRFDAKILLVDDILQIKISKRRKKFNNQVFRFIRLKIKGRIRSIIIRPSDYENEDLLIQEFLTLKEKIGKS